MIRKYTALLFACILVSSCSSEKISLSPIYDSVGGIAEQPIGPANIKDSNSEIFYASELTNQLASMPTFSNDAVNREISILKGNVKDYIYAVRGHNPKERKTALGKVEKSYKKIQELRAYMKKDDNETINRYLVRIKSNISRLEMIGAQNSSLQ